jgi:hypothetical protein
LAHLLVGLYNAGQEIAKVLVLQCGAIGCQSSRLYDTSLSEALHEATSHKRCVAQTVFDSTQLTLRSGAHALHMRHSLVERVGRSFSCK